VTNTPFAAYGHHPLDAEGNCKYQLRPGKVA
jgi:hypothetical protein